MRNVFVAMIVMSSALASGAQTSPYSDTPIEIQVTDVKASGLLTSIAELTNQNLVISSDFDQSRVSVHGKFESGTAAIVEVAKLLDGKFAKVGTVGVVQSNCVHVPAANLPGGVAPHVASIHFQRVELGAFFKVLGEHVAGSGKRSSFSSQETATFAISVRETAVGDIFEAVAAANGLELVERDQHYLFSKSQSSKACRSAGASKKEMRYEARRDLTARCRERESPSKNSPRCVPLEFYDLREISLKGHMRQGDKFVALSETPDGLVRVIERGDYMGKDYGKVIEVSAKGLELREIVLNPANTYIERKSWLSYEKE
jgi:Tfp pilus assembly protein PilP